MTKPNMPVSIYLSISICIFLCISSVFSSVCPTTYILLVLPLCRTLIGTNNSNKCSFDNDKIYWKIWLYQLHFGDKSPNSYCLNHRGNYWSTYFMSLEENT